MASSWFKNKRFLKKPYISGTLLIILLGGNIYINFNNIKLNKIKFICPKI